ncbi:Rne/Rng family ribonuclease [Fodinicola acaciae]|uniref:Rne/Rng family ribonuclease n=1 Tax=Fodinicola acaciae TaxID=2681555 RepID=UPI0013D5CCDB|nr:Rne/Rng family ribonuclease [Fodinicola acaciae]
MPTRKRSGSSGDEAAATPAETEEAVAKPVKKTARPRKTAKPKAAVEAPPVELEPVEPAPPAKKVTRKRAAKKAAVAAVEADVLIEPEVAPEVSEAPAPRKRTRRAATRAAAPPAEPELTLVPDEETAPAPQPEPEPAEKPAAKNGRSSRRAPAPMALFMAPELPEPVPAVTVEVVVDAAKGAAKGAAKAPEAAEEPAEDDDTGETDESAEAESGAESRRRRRGRRGRGRGRGASDDASESTETGDQQPAAEQSGQSEPSEQPEQAAEAESEESDDSDDSDDAAAGTTRRRRRRRRRGNETGDGDQDDDVATEVHVREPRHETAESDDGVRGVKGSTRLEAKRQRRRDGRDQGRRRPPVLTEAEFLARREAVERTMVVRQRGERTQIAVLEDNVLVEHYVTKASSTSYAGNVYLGRVQNVLPSMEAAFVDIGKGRNAVLYAGEVNWDLAGMDGKPRKIEQALKSGDSVLVQVTKDPVGHKGARLTSQVSLPGRFLVYVPENDMTGISRKLPDNERKRLKSILKKVVPENAGVIVRTAAEGASEEELRRDVARLEAQWQAIQKAQQSASAPALLYAEPDLVIRVIRDIFNEDFASLVVSSDGSKDDAWETVREYVGHVSPDLVERLSHHVAETDVFTAHRVDEQLAKALDRKVWLPSGGSLVIDRTEAMTVIDVNTGRFTGQGGNLEETVTRNNLEAAEEIVRQLRLRDIGGIIVIDFIDMVLESNRELVLRRLTECLGRDRTKHQVAEVTSLGLVQMTRKRVGQGLLEAFSETCEVCHGRGLIIHTEPVDKDNKQQVSSAEGSGRRKRNRGKDSAESAPKPRPPVEDADDVVTAEDASPIDDVSDNSLVVEPVEPVSASPAAEPAVAEAEPEPPAAEVEEPTVSVAQPTRARRTRRAASRPAGPPPQVAVGS